MELNRNVAYCFGNHSLFPHPISATFSEFGPEDMVQKHLPSILSALNVIYNDCGVYQAAQDNAAAALCRILIRFPNAVPIDKALENIVKIMPFKGDEEEEYTAIRLLLHLGNT